jgi:hypothetical protein
MAIDFPIPSVIGQKHPAVPIEGVPTYTWDGEKWITGLTSGSAFVAKAGDTMTGALVLPADPTLALQAATKQYVDGKGITRYDLNGLSSKDIQVPAGASNVHIVGVILNSTAISLINHIQLSLTPGVFITGGSDYTMYGTFWQSAAPGAMSGYSNDPRPGLYTAFNDDNVNVPAFFDAHISLKRADASRIFTCNSYSHSFYSTYGMTVISSISFLNAASSGSELAVLALRLQSIPSTPWAPTSYITTEFY